METATQKLGTILHNFFNKQISSNEKGFPVCNSTNLNTVNNVSCCVVSKHKLLSNGNPVLT